MKNIIYKYNVGDYVRFKDKFSSPTTGLVGREGTIAKITGIAFAYIIEFPRKHNLLLGNDRRLGRPGIQGSLYG